MSTIRKMLLLTVLIGMVSVFGVMLAPDQADAQTANSNIRINMPGLVWLIYSDELTITIPAADLADELTAGTGGDTEISIGATTVTGLTDDMGVDYSGSFDTAPTALVGEYTNGWQVYSIVAPTSAGVEVSVSVDTPTLIHTDAALTDEITLTGIQTRVNGSGDPFAASTTFNAGGFFTGTSGDLEFTFDITNAAHSGVYAGGVIQIQATSL